MLGVNDNVGIHPDEIKKDIITLNAIHSELENLTKQVYSVFSDVKSSKKGIDVDFLTDFQESQIDNIGVSNGNASHIIHTLNTLVQSYQEENDELIRNISSSRPNQ